MQSGRLNPQMTAQYLLESHGLKYARRTLANMRAEGTGPIYEKAGPGIRARIYYRPADIDAWVASRFRRHAATREYSGQLAA